MNLELARHYIGKSAFIHNLLEQETVVHSILCMHLSYCFISHRLYLLAEIYKLGLSFLCIGTLIISIFVLSQLAHSTLPATVTTYQMMAQLGDCSKLSMSMMLSMEIYCNENMAKCGSSYSKPHLSLHCTQQYIWRCLSGGCSVSRLLSAAISFSLPVALLAIEGRVTGLKLGNITVFLVPMISLTKTHG